MSRSSTTQAVPTVKAWRVGDADARRLPDHELTVGAIHRPIGAVRAAMDIETHDREEDGRQLPFMVCRLAPDSVVLSSAPVGGGLGARPWIINAQVSLDYARRDLGTHIDELRAVAGLATTSGVGMFTAAYVEAAKSVHESGVKVVSTVGVREPEWAAATAPEAASSKVGTINVIASVPVALSPGALVNAVITATEAKTQAMVEAGLDGSGTATDAVCIVASTSGPPEPFAGPRSRWGHPLAVAVHATVRDGIASALGAAS